jgi:hypothetical protein
MRAIAQYDPGLAGRGRTFHPINIPADLSVVCLWSALGLTLAALLCSAGIGSDMGELLAAFG